MTDSTSLITRPLPNAVTYDLSERGRVTITLPPRSTWSSGLHWHQDHDEYLRVMRGRIHVSLDGTERAVGADEPEVRIPRRAWHSWRRADEDGDVVVVERTEPVDLQKALFFWNLNGVILDVPGLDAKLKRLPSWLRHLLLDLWVTLSLFVIFHRLDNFPVLLNAPRVFRRFEPWLGGNGMVSQVSQKVDWLCTHTVLWLAAVVGRFLGVAPVQRRHTPADIYSQWCEDQHRSKKTS